MKHLHSFARRAAAFLLAAVLCVCIPAAAASAATTIGGADTTLIPAEDENCLSWLFGSKDKITMPYLNIKGQGLKRNVTLDLEDCLVGITYTELGSIGSYVSASAAQQAWKAQAVAVHSYLEYHKQYGSSTNALIYTPVDQIPASARNAIRKAVQAVKDEVLVYNGSVCDAVWSASAGYNTQTGVYGTCASLDAWGTDVPYLQSVESPYEEQYHKLLRRVIGKDYTYIEYNDSRTGEPYQSADTTHKDLGGFVQYNTLVSNGRSYRYINQSFLPLLLRFRHRCQRHPLHDLLRAMGHGVGHEPVRRSGLRRRGGHELQADTCSTTTPGRRSVPALPAAADCSAGWRDCSAEHVSLKFLEKPSQNAARFGILYPFVKNERET